MYFLLLFQLFEKTQSKIYGVAAGKIKVEEEFMFLFSLLLLYYRSKNTLFNLLFMFIIGKLDIKGPVFFLKRSTRYGNECFTNLDFVVCSVLKIPQISLTSLSHHRPQIQIYKVHLIVDRTKRNQTIFPQQLNQMFFSIIQQDLQYLQPY